MKISKCNKWIKLILSVVLIISSMFIFSSSRGCLSPYVENITVVTTEDFILIDYENATTRNVFEPVIRQIDGKKALYFYDLSEQGKQKKNIILPKMLNGNHLLFRRALPWCEEYPCEEFEPWTYFKSENLEKLYIWYDSHLEYYSTSILFNQKDLPKLKKFITNEKWLPEGLIVYFNLIDYYNVYEHYIENKEKIEQILQRNGNYYFGELSARFFHQIRLTNMQFMYNYDNAENDGYYWIDDINNGEKIEIIPENPIREGYSFGGWYNEPECITEFNFNQVFNKSVIDEFTEYPENYVTFAYAKWVKN